MARYCPYCASRVDQGNTCPYCNYASTYTPKPHHLKPGTLLRRNRYLVGRVLGEGGFGITYVGRDTTLDMKVAIKEYFPNSMVQRTNMVSNTVSLVNHTLEPSFKTGRDQFIEEARRLADLDKESAVVTVRDFFGENESAYIVMEFIEGDDLKSLIKKNQKPLEPKKLFDLLEPIFKALSKVHEKGLVHRDISPDNIMVEDGRARLIDFGCAGALNKGSAAEATLKHSFSPVEQYNNENMGPWTDVYAMASTIYYCITGRLVPRATDRVIKDELIPPTALGAKISKRQERAILKALAVKPENRYQTMDAFGKDLFVHKNVYKYLAIAASLAAVCAVASLLIFKPQTVVKTVEKEYTVTIAYGIGDDISKEEKKVIEAVSALVKEVELCEDESGYHYTFNIQNDTGYRLEDVIFIITFYDKDNAVVGSGSTQRIKEWEKGNSASLKAYCNGTADHADISAEFNYGSKLLKTASFPTALTAKKAGILIELSEELPITIKRDTYNGSVEVVLTSFDYEANKSGNDYYVKFKFGGYLNKGSISYNSVSYRMLDSRGTVVSSGSVIVPNVKEGERFENAGTSVFDLAEGTYRIEFIED